MKSAKLRCGQSFITGGAVLLAAALLPEVGEKAAPDDFAVTVWNGTDGAFLRVSRPWSCGLP